MIPPSATMTPSAPVGGTTTSAVKACDLFLVLTIELSVSRPMPPNRICRLPLINCGRPARSGLARSANRSSSGSTLYLTASISHSRCSACSLSGFSFARFFDWRPVRGGVVQLPDIVVEGGQLDLSGLPRRSVSGHRGPALVVDAAVARHLEILRLAPLGRLGVVERVQHADAFDRALLHAVDEDRLGQAGRFQNGRRNVDDVMELACGSRPWP